MATRIRITIAVSALATLIACDPGSPPDRSDAL
jgi:hypothetical protein